MSRLTLSGENGKFTLAGDLTRDNVPYLEKEEAQLWQQKSLQLDLQQTDNSDMTGLAWLVKLATKARREKVDLKLISVPETIRKLAKISDVDELLPLQ
ncbi:STAS domain-containing protein [Bowmanella dokdonensis]|uniref:STAS domain-containing protein n=1 Tax=Bowmanella dokdonensis TaxID=751969 RepID=A0A939DKB1_9ALTE|nr:STAS domain-containing protein [Bowmanella dokdonensis]